MRAKTLGVAVVLVLFPALLSAAAGPIKADPDKTWVHAPSKWEFPVKVGEFQRISVYQYDENGRDVSVGYNQKALHITATAYVYPNGGTELAKHLEQVQAELMQVHPDAKLQSQGDWTLKQGERQFTGLKATYTWSEPARPTDRPIDVTSEVYVLKLGDWFIKYRITYPTAGGDGAAKQVAALQAALTLP
jgi:hypothetical protein